MLGIEVIDNMEIAESSIPPSNFIMEIYGKVELSFLRVVL